MNDPTISSSLPKPRASSGKSWQQTKSENTRLQILEATLYCFSEYGFHNTTTEKVSKQAKVSRGAMLHHFSQRAELVRAAVEHLHEKRLQEYERDLRALNEDAKHTLVAEGIEVFWRQLQSPLFAIYCELLVAARTDDELRRTLLQPKRPLSGLGNLDRKRSSLTLRYPSSFGSRLPQPAICWRASPSIPSHGGDHQIALPQEMLSWLKETVSGLLSDVSRIDRNTAMSAKGAGKE